MVRYSPEKVEAKKMGLRGRSNLIEERFFFVTTTVVRFAPVFTNDRYRDILVRNIKHYQNNYKFAVLGYVIMPSHFHWLVQVNPEFGTISDIMRHLKKYSAWDVMQALQKDKKENLLKLFEQEAQGAKDQRRKFWMKRFDDEVIRNRGMFMAKLKYIHDNPVKAGLVAKQEDYKYSSARNYLLGDHSVLTVDTDVIA